MKLSHTQTHASRPGIISECRRPEDHPVESAMDEFHVGSLSDSHVVFEAFRHVSFPPGFREYRNKEQPGYARQASRGDRFTNSIAVDCIDHRLVAARNRATPRYLENLRIEFACIRRVNGRFDVRDALRAPSSWN
jgi:hypothetical protein